MRALKYLFFFISRASAVAAVLAVLAVSSPLTVSAAGSGETDARVDELERKLEIITEELRRIRDERSAPAISESVAKGIPTGGGGTDAPGASKVYAAAVQQVSIGGYGEFNLKSTVDDDDGEDDVFDLLRFVLYFGYKFTDHIVLNSEIEFEHASTGGDGEVSVEALYLDYLLNEYVNLRAGLLLMPVGFVNELHEPPFFHGNDRPAVERQIIPSTWRANGAGVYGNITPSLSYKSYVVTSLLADEFSSSNLRGGRQKGSKEKANDWSWVGRLDWEPTAGLDLGGSIYVGNQGQNQEVATAFDIDGNPTATTKVSALMQMYEAHLQWKYRGFETRLLGVYTDLEDADVLSVGAGETIAENMMGWYAELAYDVGPVLFPNSEKYVAPWFRYSKYDTQHDVPSGFSPDQSKDRNAYEMGVTFKPIPNVALKLDYRIQDARSGDQPDEVRIGAGFIF
jgi:opacity protein-like surface antigen